MTMPIETSKAPKQTLVEEGTEFKGTLKSSCAVVVNGTINVYIGRKCDGGANSRAVAAVYSIETSSNSQTRQCTES